MLGTVVLTAAVRLPSFVHGLFDPDEASIGVQAIGLRHGATLYVDVADRKPPIPPVLYAAVFRLLGSVDLRPLHVLAALFLVGAALVLSLDARRRFGTTAAWVVAVLTVVGAVAFMPADGQAANFAHFALLPGAAAVVWCRRGSTRWALLGGLALGLAVLCRQSWIVGIVPAVVGAMLAGKRRDGLAVVAGTTVGVLAAALLAPFGDFWRWTFSGNEGFATASASAGPTLARFAGSVALFVALHLVLVAGVALAASRRLSEPRRWRDDVDLWLWLAVGLLAVVTGLRFFGHYWLQTLPVAVVITAAVLFDGPDPLAARLGGGARRLGLATVAASGAVAVALGFVPATIRHLPDPDELAAYVDAHSAPGDAVLVWGNLPEVLLAADRQAGGALVHSDFVTGRSGGRPSGPQTLAQATPGAFDQMMGSLRAHPPALVLDTSTADLRGYGDYPLATFPELRHFVDDHYELVGRVDGVDVYAPAAR